MPDALLINEIRGLYVSLRSMSGSINRLAHFKGLKRTNYLRFAHMKLPFLDSLTTCQSDLMKWVCTNVFIFLSVYTRL